MIQRLLRHHLTLRLLVITGLTCLLMAAAALGQELVEVEATPPPAPPSPLHPAFALLDADGVNVRDSGGLISTMTTCGTCHDVAFISAHGVHTDGAIQSGQYLYPASDTTAASSGVEMNCFLCHTRTPDNTARRAALAADPATASTATLNGTGIVSADGAAWTYNADAFAEDGTVDRALIAVGDPTADNCAACHGAAAADARQPLQLTYDSSAWMTFTTGQVFAPQRISQSAANLADKADQSRSWDIHAERVVGCTDCHYALNNPVYDTSAAITRPDHLTFDPRRMDFGEYLYRPLHALANSDAAALDFDGSSRPCAGCHDAASTHTWLPYTDRHISVLACETCHTPTLYAPAAQTIDWTAVDVSGAPLTTYRGLQADGLITGYQPVLLPAVGADGVERLTPHNLVTTSYWVSGADDAVVPQAALMAAWLDGDAYAGAVLAAFDSDGDGALSADEARLDTDAKIAVIVGRLAEQGYPDARISSEVIPYPIHHGTNGANWATRDCADCHADESRVAVPIALTRFTPGGGEPRLVSAEASLNGTFIRDDSGMLYYQPALSMGTGDLYVLGHNRVEWVDVVGTLMFLGVAGGAALHGGLRYVALRRLRRQVGHVPAEVRSVYMYSIYERQWHWLQTAAIFGLLFTGVAIHYPTLFSAFSFDVVVIVHNALAVILVINAALSLFYHLVSGEIRQYLPRPYGFFDQMFAQAKYYLLGIFKGEEHPMEKTPQRKLNPLQQLTYLAILNVLLPLQIITGALMWGAQQFPDLTARLGGLAFLGPFHTLVAWSFASFILMHVYLTTTGHTPLANIKAMMLGWDEVETHPSSSADTPELKGEVS